MTLKVCQYCGLAYEGAMTHECAKKGHTVRTEDRDLDRLIRESGERYAAMSPIERAIHDIEQRRSGARGLAKMSTPREELDTAFDAMPEIVLLRAYREAKSALQSEQAKCAVLSEALKPFAAARVNVNQERSWILDDDLDRAAEALSNAPASSARKTGVELHCDDCQSPYAVWFAPNPIWNLVIGGPDCKGDPGGMLCPRCFTLRAEAAGVKPTAWEVKPEAADDCPLCPPLPGKN